MSITRGLCRLKGFKTEGRITRSNRALRGHYLANFRKYLSGMLRSVAEASGQVWKAKRPVL
jgi:hypothetical protein